MKKRLSEEAPLTAEFFAEAACVGMDGDIFFPEAGGSPEARRVCAVCPVQQECLSWAMTWGENIGIWGGVSATRRAVLARTGGAEDWVPYFCGGCDEMFMPLELGQDRCSNRCRRKVR
jgi:hypothetical protein